MIEEEVQRLEELVHSGKISSVAFQKAAAIARDFDRRGREVSRFGSSLSAEQLVESDGSRIRVRVRFGKQRQSFFTRLFSRLFSMSRR